MNEITCFEHLCQFFNDSVASNPDKPIIIWFGREAGLSNILIDRFNKDFINPKLHLSVLKENLGNRAISKCKENAIVFHRYLGQMEDSFLKVVLETKRQTRKPVFLLANIYEADNKPDWVSQLFEEVLYSPIMEIALVACSKTKALLSSRTTIRAEELYTSPLFKKAWKYANSLNVDQSFILSDKYGLLNSTDLVSPYDQDLKSLSPQQRGKWAKSVIADLTRKGFDIVRDHFVLLAGQQYCKELLGKEKIENGESLFKSNDLRGIGCILRFLS